MTKALFLERSMVAKWWQEMQGDGEAKLTHMTTWADLGWGPVVVGKVGNDTHNELGNVLKLLEATKIYTAFVTNDHTTMKVHDWSLVKAWERHLYPEGGNLSWALEKAVKDTPSTASQLLLVSGSADHAAVAKDAGVEFMLEQEWFNL